MLSQQVAALKKIYSQKNPGRLLLRGFVPSVMSTGSERRTENLMDSLPVIPVAPAEKQTAF
jgi:hypothetical protein